VGVLPVSDFPSRCQHIKVNGTQCGSPALRRNRFCFFHKRFQTERLSLHKSEVNQARARRRAAISHLPVLEDANSIQVSLMQIMRLLALGHLDPKTAGLLLYALQTASLNLRRTNFEPRIHDIVLDPRTVGDTLLGENVWNDEDFEDEDDEEAEREEAEEEAKQRALERDAALWRGSVAEHKRIADEEHAQDEAYRMRQEAEKQSEVRIARENAERAQATKAKIESGARRPPANVDLDEVREQVREVVRKALLPLASAKPANG
jgi:hypothetical protein